MAPSGSAGSGRRQRQRSAAAAGTAAASSLPWYWVRAAHRGLAVRRLGAVRKAMFGIVDEPERSLSSERGRAQYQGRLLHLERSSGYSSLSNDPEAIMPTSRNLTAASDAGRSR